MIGFIQTGRDHHILRLQQSSHHIQHSGFAYIDGLLQIGEKIKIKMLRVDVVSHTSLSLVSGVYPVIKKCNCGVGINGAVRPIKLLFIYDGYRNVVVLTDIMVDTSVLICVKLGFCKIVKESVNGLRRWNIILISVYLKVETIGCDSIQCCVIEYDDTISTTCQSTKCQQRIVWLNDDITGNQRNEIKLNRFLTSKVIVIPDFILIRKHTVRLYEFLWKSIGQSFHNV